MKNIIGILLILFIGGFYTMGFGVYELAYNHVLANSLFLIIFGWFVCMFAVVSFLEWRRE